MVDPVLAPFAVSLSNRPGMTRALVKARVLRLSSGRTVAEGVAGTVAEGVAGTVAEGVAGTVAEGAAGTVAEGVAGTVAEGAAGTVAEGAAGTVAEGLAGRGSSDRARDERWQANSVGEGWGGAKQRVTHEP